MFFSETIEGKNASPALQQLYDKNKATLGYVTNYTRLFSHRPDLMVAWINLIGSICDHVDQRRYELITLAAAKTLKSSYCSLAHGAILKEKFYSQEQLNAIVSDCHYASLTGAEIAMMSFAEKIVLDGTSITEKDVEELKSHGFSDTEIFEHYNSNGSPSLL